MTRSRKNRCVPSITTLEPRCMLSSVPSASWLGQDGHDLAGGLTAGTGNGVQDIHVALSGLPTGRAINSIDVRGFGGGEWVVNIGPYNVYNGVLSRAAGSIKGDLYLDPYINESGRSFTLALTYDDGTSAVVTMNGGTANANLRMPADAVAVSWHGQDGQDLTGPTPAVGPDGVQDVHLALSRLFPSTGVRSVDVSLSADVGWASGLNPNPRMNAELVRSGPDPSVADLYFSPDRDLYGQTLSVDVTYDDGKIDHTTIVAGHSSTTLAVPAPAPISMTWDTFQAAWLGQDGINLVGLGDVHVALSGLPAGHAVTSVTLNDTSGLDWNYTKAGSGFMSADSSARPLGFRIPGDATKADLSFAPNHDETGKTLTLVVTLDDGRMLATHLTGGAADPGLRASNVASSSVVAHPGDDLNDLANRFGTVRLVAGFYPLNRPLVLSRPVTIRADPGATLLFMQDPSGSTWTAAVKVLAGHTTLDGFAVRFAGPVRWTAGISHGPAVVGVVDNYDPWSADPLVDLTFTHLDLQSPPASSSWEEAPEMFRLINAESGVVADNRLKGGTTEFSGGPWTVTGNQFVGTPVNTFTYAAFGGHFTHDLILADNVVAPTGRTGKTWRFLVLTQNGRNDIIRDNTSIGVGPMDSDTVANPNAPENILTEAYRLHYEGMVAAVSPDGQIVQIPAPQNGSARTGDVLAILSGPQAGQWRTILQALSPTAYLLDAPIMGGKFAVSVATGFANETFQGNSVDTRGSSIATDLVLAGNQYGVSVVGNHFVGGAYGFSIDAYPTEQPNIWGWSYAPVLGATIDGNTVQDTLYGALIDVAHSTFAKSTAGRVYFSGEFRDNLGIWSDAFVAVRSSLPWVGPAALVTIGDRLSHDPGELQLAVSGNLVQGPATVVNQPTFIVPSATINGIPLTNVSQTLPTISLGPLSVASVRSTPSPTVVRPIPIVKSSTQDVAKPVVIAPVLKKSMRQVTHAKPIPNGPTAAGKPNHVAIGSHRPKRFSHRAPTHRNRVVKKISAR